MKTAILTCIDDNLSTNFEEDFLQTLRNRARYDGLVYVIYYGNDKKFARIIKKKYKVKVILANKKLMPSNQRNLDFIHIIEKLPKKITNILCIDGGDVWFQEPINELFNKTRSGYGFVEESLKADEDFNRDCLNLIIDGEIRNLFFERAKGYKLINGGFLIGDRQKILHILELAVKWTKKINQDFFALDQSILNYIVRDDGNGLSLPKKYCFTLLSDKNRFYVKDGLFYEKFTNELISIIHNAGNNQRIFPQGRKNLALKKLPGSFWGLTSYFNPAKYANKIENYRIFREKSKKQGLKLLCVELAFNNDSFELNKEDADILIQVRSNSIMWQKERLLNIGLKKLPKDCDKVVWVDADVIFLNNNWIEDTSKLLEKHILVQPFSFVAKSSKYSSDFNFQDLSFGYEDGEISHGFAYGAEHFGEPVLNSQNYIVSGNTGYAWSARRDFLENCRFYDKSIMGANDAILAYALYGKTFNKLLKMYPEKLSKDVCDYIKKVFFFAKGNVSYTNNIIIHIWHGTFRDRRYNLREAIFKKYDFDPKMDLKLNEAECYEWASDKKEMHREAQEYFFQRKEDS
ncbi:MAG: hypothetical protein PHF67_03820 [Candidatus Nanoarchaeia archaeon]|nr:hypothetical protein [Candidatus Nanoarchaeia archaeon]